MTRTLFTNIGLLVTNNPSEAVRAGGTQTPTGEIENAAMIVDNGLVAWVGRAVDAETGGGFDIDAVVNLHGNTLIPGFVDSHSHIVFAGNRAGEFAARMAGKPYAAGGIRSTVAATREASDEELRERLHSLLREMHAQGTTTVEIKSGYGLDVATEERLVRLAREVSEEVTFLGAHVVPAEFTDNREDYVQLVIGEMLEKSFDEHSDHNGGRFRCAETVGTPAVTYPACTPVADYGPDGGETRPYDDALANGSLMQPKEVADSVMFMLTRPRNVVIRDLVILPLSVDL